MELCIINILITITKDIYYKDYQHVKNKKSLNTYFSSFLFMCGSSTFCYGNNIEKPNIIIVLADDQGWGDMGYNGHPVIQTPNFDNMAKSGLRLDRFNAAAPVSSPTRGSILTGRHPNRFGCFTWGYTIRHQETTIAERLQEAGYQTAHFGKWHLETIYKDSPVNPGNCGFDEWISSPNFFDNNPILSKEGIAVQYNGESSIVTMNAAIEFIEKFANKTPFFAYVCFGSPHLSHIAKEQDRIFYPYLEKQFQNYYGEIGGMDRAVGLLRAKLRELEIEENTIIWFMSDNGGIRDSNIDPSTEERKYFSLTGGRDYKGSIYEGGHRVPCIIEWPQQIRKSCNSNLTCFTSDIYSTILEIVGIDINKSEILDGMSILPLIKGKMKKRNKPLAFWKFSANGKSVSSIKIMKELLNYQIDNNHIKFNTKQLILDASNIDKIYTEKDLNGHAAWLEWPYKLHRINKDNDEVIYELYDLDNDPWEENDISLTQTSIMRSMSANLNRWMMSVINSLNGNDYNSNFFH